MPPLRGWTAVVATCVFTASVRLEGVGSFIKIKSNRPAAVDSPFDYAQGRLGGTVPVFKI